MCKSPELQAAGLFDLLHQIRDSTKLGTTRKSRFMLTDVVGEMIERPLVSSLTCSLIIALSIIAAEAMA